MNVGIALRAGLSNDNFVNSLIVEFFSAIVIVAVVTTLVTPIGLLFILSNRKK